MLDFKKLFQDVPAVTNQNAGVPSNPVPQDLSFTEKFGLAGRKFPFFQKADPFLASMIGQQGADAVADQGTGAGALNALVTYGITGRPDIAFASGVKSAGEYSDSRKKGIFDLINYQKSMKELSLMDFNALPESYKTFGLMTENPAFAKYQYMKDMYTKDMKEFEYSKNNKDFIDFLLKMNKSRQAFSQVNIGNKNASDQFYKITGEGFDESNKAYKGLQMTERMIDMYNNGFTGGMGKELAFQFTPFFQIFNKNFNQDELAQLQDFKAVSNQVVLPQVKQLGFNPTNVDLAFIVNSSPQLKNTDQGNLLMLDALKEGYTRIRMVQDHMDKWGADNAQLIEQNVPKALNLYKLELRRIQNKVLEDRKSYRQRLKDTHDQIINAQSNQSGSTTNVNPNFKRRDEN